MLFLVYCLVVKQTFLKLAPEVKQDHPLNLSISFSGGKETN